MTIEEYSHNADSHVHVKCLANDNIIEINEEEFIDKIKDHQVFEGFDISKLQLVVEGACKHYNSELCKDKDYCYLEKIKMEAIRSFPFLIIYIKTDNKV